MSNRTRPFHRLTAGGVLAPINPAIKYATSVMPARKQDTRKVSLELFKQGRSIARIASERGLASSTIEGHLAYFISKGELGIGKVLTDEKRRIIEQKIIDLPGKSLKNLKTSLGETCSYGEIKLVLAHLEHQ